MKQLVFICVAVLLLSAIAVGQKSKPWTEWTEKEAAKILNDSAWGQTETETAAAAEPTSTSAISQTTAARREDQRISAANSVESGETKVRPSISFRVRFLSAKPVRAAFVRMIELQGAAPEKVEQLRTFVDRDFCQLMLTIVNVSAWRMKKLTEATKRHCKRLRTSSVRTGRDYF